MLPTVPLFVIFSFLGFMLSFVPLYWQFEAWNVGTLWYMFWIALSCFTQYFNAIVWAGNATNLAPAWCEISIRLTMAVSVGLPAASLCINRRLHTIACMPPSASASALSKADKRRAIIVDSFISGLFPTLYILLQLVVQRHRFNVLEDVGCAADFYDSLPTYLISYSTPLLLSFGSFVYAVLLLCTVSATRANLPEVLAPHKNLTPSRLLRLTGLAVTTLFLTLPLGLLNIAGNATIAAVSTQVSGDTAPFNFGVVAEIPRALWAANETTHLAIELTRWIAPACAIILFVFLGFGKEAREYYIRAFTTVSNAFWNSLARMGYVRPLPPLPSAQADPRRRPFGRHLSTPGRKYAISYPIRGASGTGSFADLAVSLPEAESKASPNDTMLTTFSPPLASPPSAHSYFGASPLPGEPGEWVLESIYSQYSLELLPSDSEGRVCDSYSDPEPPQVPHQPSRGRTIA
ncbi:pheromone receptor Rcb2 B44 [Mycena vitilis]|nr:pheromone receptor Rcb2 B44 [Mycena vitilis]